MLHDHLTRDQLASLQAGLVINWDPTLDIVHKHRDTTLPMILLQGQLRDSAHSLANRTSADPAARAAASRSPFTAGCSCPCSPPPEERRRAAFSRPRADTHVDFFREPVSMLPLACCRASSLLLPPLSLPCLRLFVPSSDTNSGSVLESLRTSAIFIFYSFLAPRLDTLGWNGRLAALEHLASLERNTNSTSGPASS